MRMPTSENPVTLVQGDCRAYLPAIAPATVAAVVTDPPYGGYDRWSGGGWQSGNCGRGKLWNSSPSWDTTPDREAVQAVIRAAPSAILWGGNFFDGLPPTRGWLVWDKEADTTQGHAELAWTNLDTAIRVYRRSPLGVFGNGGRNGEVKVHPTQKPTELMRWCIQLAKVPPGGIILDPYMGSGTTGVAAIQLGYRFIGIELDSAHYATARKRIDAALGYGTLFAPAAPVAADLYAEPA